jgi:hypothetical protein
MLEVMLSPDWQRFRRVEITTFIEKLRKACKDPEV